jgi:hypothetical protein
MGLPYIPNKQSWTEITREERYFCSELFHEFKNRPSDLVQIINKTVSTKLDVCEEWELGLEVCFYRDLLKAYKFGIREVNNGREQDSHFPQKRTFDLCLFSKKEIIIIEAKSQSGLTEGQMKDFDLEKSRINELFDFIDKRSIEVLSRPTVRLILVASTKYLTSNRSLLKSKKPDSEEYWSSVFCGQVTWAELSNSVHDSRVRVLLKWANDLHGK